MPITIRKLRLVQWISWIFKAKTPFHKAQINSPESVLSATVSNNVGYDIIFAGGTFLLPSYVTPASIKLTGGTAACVAASRLAKADPSLKILAGRP